MTIGIYCLTFYSTNKVYVGQSIDIERRYKEHLQKLKNNTHTVKLLNAYTTYGVPSIKILCICSKESLNMYEDIFIQYYNSSTEGFNHLEKSTDLPTPNNSGTLHGLSKYSEDQIVKVLDLLIEKPFIRYIKISNITGVGYQAVGNIAALNEHTWLKKVYPEKYKILEELKGTRTKNIPVNTAEDRGIKYPAVISPNGEIFDNILNVSKFMKDHGITSRRFYDLLNRKETKIMGWVLA